MMKYLMSLVIRKLQIETSMTYHFKPTKIAKTKMTGIAKVDKDVAK